VRKTRNAQRPFRCIKQDTAGPSLLTLLLNALTQEYPIVDRQITRVTLRTFIPDIPQSINDQDIIHQINKVADAPSERSVLSKAEVKVTLV